MAQRGATFIPAHLEWGAVLRTGLIGGIIAAVAMMVGEMAAAMMMGMDIFMPPRMMAGTLLGMPAMDPAQVSLMTALLAGVGVHMVLSLLYGVAFAAVAAAIPALRPGSIFFLGLVAGLVLWVVNFYVIPPVAGWTWFPEQTQPLIQAVMHALFGGALGWYVGAFGGPERHR